MWEAYARGLAQRSDGRCSHRRHCWCAATPVKDRPPANCPVSGPRSVIMGSFNPSGLRPVSDRLAATTPDRDLGCRLGNLLRYEDVDGSLLTYSTSWAGHGVGGCLGRSMGLRGESLSLGLRGATFRPSFRASWVDVRCCGHGRVNVASS